VQAKRRARRVPICGTNASRPFLVASIASSSGSIISPVGANHVATRKFPGDARMRGCVRRLPPISPNLNAYAEGQEPRPATSQKTSLRHLRRTFDEGHLVRTSGNDAFSMPPGA